MVRTLLLMLACLTAISASAGEWLAAAGKHTIEVPDGTYLAGYGRDRTSTGRLDNLYLKVAVIGDTQQQIAILTIDCIGLTRPDILKIKQMVAQQHPNLQVVVSSTHTHAAPDVVGLWGARLWRSGRDPSLMSTLIRDAAQLVSDTAVRLRPVKSFVTSLHTPQAWVENVSEPELLDAQLSVLQFVDEQGASVLTLTNYACHPTVLGPNNHRVSADYLAGFYQHMEQISGEHLFLQGAIGGWVQPLQGDRSVQRAQALGEQLAQATLSALQQRQDNPYAQLQYRQRTIDLELDNWGFRLMMWLQVLERELHAGAMRTEVAWFQIGGAQFVTHPGETSPAYSIASRQLMNTPHSFVLGLSQDALGYILKPDYFDDDATYPHREYLTSVSVGRDAGPAIMSALAELTAEGK